MALFTSVTLPYPYHPTVPWTRPIPGSSTIATTTSTNEWKFKVSFQQNIYKSWSG